MNARRHMAQGGVAVVTALLLTTLAVTIVTSLFWQQQVQVRMMANQRLQTQAQWVMRNSLDWARLVLREDAKSTTVDQLGEDWAQPQADIPLDQFIQNDRLPGEDAAATLSRRIEDAQGRYNIGNLAQNGVQNASQLAVFERLLSLLNLAPELAKPLAAAVAAGQGRNAPLAPDGSMVTVGQPAPAALAVTSVDALLAVPGYTAAVVARLQPYVAILPETVPVNANTASAQVLAALMNVSLSDVAPLLQHRAHAYFRDLADFQTTANNLLSEQDVAVSSSYFLVENEVHMERAVLRTQALVYRKKTGNTTVLRVRAY